MPASVQLLVTCLIDGLFPRVGEAVVELLEAQGHRVEFPSGQTCCGQPAYNAGLRDEAAAVAAHTVRVLDATEGPIVVPSGSCAEMVIHRAPGLLAGDDELARAAERVAGRTRELTVFLTEAGPPPPSATQPATITFHPSCHGLRGLGIREQPEALLRSLDGLDVVDLPDAEECCGFGGLFSIELPEVSAALLEAKIDNVLDTGADMLVGGDVGCLMHIEGGLRRRGSSVTVAHIAELMTRPS